MLLVNTAASVHTRTARPLDVDRPVRRREDSAPTVGRGPFGPRPRTVCAVAKGTARAVIDAHIVANTIHYIIFII